MLRLHATCVVFEACGILLTGPSGAGKSDLALRVIDAGGELVADDQVELSRHGATLVARPSTVLAGLLEVRGLGLLRLPHQAEARLGLLIDLVAAERVPRLPGDGVSDLLGVVLPRLLLTPFEPSALAKLRLAVRLATGHIMRAP